MTCTIFCKSIKKILEILQMCLTIFFSSKYPDFVTWNGDGLSLWRASLTPPSPLVRSRYTPSSTATLTRKKNRMGSTCHFQLEHNWRGVLGTLCSIAFALWHGAIATIYLSSFPFGEIAKLQSQRSCKITWQACDWERGCNCAILNVGLHLLDVRDTDWLRDSRYRDMVERGILRFVCTNTGGQIRGGCTRLRLRIANRTLTCSWFCAFLF